MTEGNWLQTDEADDVAGSIRHVLRSAEFVAEDPQAWKWVALSLHSALQGACVCHLTTSAPPIGAVTPRNAAEWLAYHEKSRSDPDAKPPRSWLMELPDLLKAIRKPHSAGDRSNLAGIELSNAELNWLRRFHKAVRNQFVHFEPMGWSLELSGIPEIAVLVSRIVRDIADAGWAFRHTEHEWRRQLYDDLKRLETSDFSR
jgi:hypothetical protein